MEETVLSPSLEILAKLRAVMHAVAYKAVQACASGASLPTNFAAAAAPDPLMGPPTASAPQIGTSRSAAASAERSPPISLSIRFSRCCLFAVVAALTRSASLLCRAHAPNGLANVRPSADGNRADSETVRGLLAECRRRAGDAEELAVQVEIFKGKLLENQVRRLPCSCPVRHIRADPRP